MSRAYRSLLVSLVGLALWGSCAHAQLGDVTNSLTFMGNPFLAQWPDGTPEKPSQLVCSRSVWSMFLTEQVAFTVDAPPIHFPYTRLWLGAGDFFLNTGPVYPVYLGVRSPVLGCDGNVSNCGFFAYSPPANTHQISLYRDLYPGTGSLFFPSDQVYINPATCGSHCTLDTGSFYSRALDSFWQEHRTIPGALHTFDIVSWQTPVAKLFVATASSLDANNVYRQAGQYSLDGGDTWADLTCGGVACSTYGSTNSGKRLNAFFTLGGELYVAGQLGLFRINTTTNDLISRADIQAQMFPNGTKFPWATVPFASGIVYISGIRLPTVSSGPSLMYVTASGITINTPTVVTLPYVNAFPRDLRVIGANLYLLSYHDEGANVYTVYLHKSSDLTGNGHWTEVLHFQTIPAGGIGQSFAWVPTDGVLDVGHAGYLYFGLGAPCILDGTGNAYIPATLSNAAGQIQRKDYTP